MQVKSTLLTAAAVLAISTTGGFAQTNQQPQMQREGQTQAGGQQSQQQGAQQQIAQQCLDELQQLTDRMNEEGYWLTGYRYGWRGYGVGPAVGGMPGAPAAGGAAAGGTQLQQGAGIDYGPWGTAGWTTSPRRDILALYNAAVVLAQRGESDACQTVVGQLDQMYGQYTAQLQEAGVNPEEVSGWRAEQIAAAVPVDNLQRPISLDEVVDTDLRSPNDEDLGEVEDVVIDPATGEFRYAIVSRGGFLGIGERMIAVPWDRLNVTPGFNTFVLNVDEQTLERAPELQGQGGYLAQGDNEATREIDQFWNEITD